MSFLPEGYVMPGESRNYKGIRTHSRYAINIYRLMADNQLSFDLKNRNVYQGLAYEQKILKKLDIVKYTLDSIKTEFTFSRSDDEFLPLALSWLWIKGYYAVFHLASLLIALENTDARYVVDRKYNEHTNILKMLNSLITNERPFTTDSLNDCYTGEQLQNYINKSHDNLRNVPTFNQDIYKLSLKKAYMEKMSVELKGLKGVKRKSKLQKINARLFSVFDLFLYYRELFNYSGFKYLDTEGEFYNQRELNKFYQASCTVITTTSSLILRFLQQKTSGNIRNKLASLM